jgi:hypothetical protein
MKSKKKPQENTNNKKFPELIIGLAGGVGTPLTDIMGLIGKELKEFGYSHNEITLPKFLRQLFKNETKKLKKYIPIDTNNKFKDISEKMRICTNLRHDLKEPGIMAILGIAEIIKLRRKQKNTLKIAYIIKSLKKPEEIELLKRVYGANFILISV